MLLIIIVSVAVLFYRNKIFEIEGFLYHWSGNSKAEGTVTTTRSSCFCSDVHAFKNAIGRPRLPSEKLSSDMSLVPGTGSDHL